MTMQGDITDRPVNVSGISGANPDLAWCLNETYRKNRRNRIARRCNFQKSEISRLSMDIPIDAR